MSKTHDKARLDWLVELTGASAPALAVAFAAAKLAPINGWPIATSVALAASGVFAAAYCAMRAARWSTRRR